MLADIALRRRDYAEPELYDPAGRYGDVRWFAGRAARGRHRARLGPGHQRRPPAGSAWQGYLLGPLGLGGREGAWAYANLGVLVALAVGFVGGLALDRGRVRAQEA